MLNQLMPYGSGVETGFGILPDATGLETAAVFLGIASEAALALRAASWSTLLGQSCLQNGQPL